MRPINSIADRFWSRVRKGEGCWLWLAGLDTHGYGKVSCGGRRVGAHRAAWLLTRGEIPPGLLVCHHCDNRRCCNPAHMFLGTLAENDADKRLKGREPSRVGEWNGRAKLRWADVETIRIVSARGAPVGELAARFKVSRTTIQGIVSGRRWQVTT